jgi:hypothetical protein
VTEVAGTNTAIFIVTNNYDLSPTVNEREIKVWIASRKDRRRSDELSTTVAEVLFRKQTSNKAAADRRERRGLMVLLTVREVVVLGKEVSCQ